MLIDARHGIKEIDRELFRMLDEFRRPYQVVLTKTDLVNVDDLAKSVPTKSCVRKCFFGFFPPVSGMA